MTESAEILKRLAARAVVELRRANQWDGREEGLACKSDTDPDTSRAVILYILRGESPQSIIVEFALQGEWKKSVARSYVDEIKTQIKSFFADDNRYDWPEGFSIEELKSTFPRLFAPWTLDEKLCLENVIGKFLPEYLSYEHLTGIFQRPSQSIRRALSSYSLASKIEDSSAVNVLGAQIRCGNCPHSTVLKYATLEAIASRTSKSVPEVSTTTLLDWVTHLACPKCKLKSAALSI